MAWTMTECKALPNAGNTYLASCALIEGDEMGENHTHWQDDVTEVEVVVAWHKKGERPKPNCQVRRPGVN